MIALALLLGACRSKPSEPVGVSTGPTATSSVRSTRIAAGAPCTAESKHACQEGSVLRCDRGTWSIAARCRGPRGCTSDDASIGCDDSIAIEGDPCDTPSQVACSADGGAELACRDGGFTRTRVCRGPCQVIDAGVLCE